MPFFSKRDRIAIVVICGLIVAGWGIRWFLAAGSAHDEVRVIRNAVEVPESFHAEKQSQPLLIDINAATASELESLPMIGPVKAAAIVQYREKNGPFATPDALVKVPGIGKTTFERISVSITVGVE